MSVTVLTDVLWSKITPAAVKWTLSVMADRVNDEGRGFFYSVPTLALLTGQSERTVQRHLDRLLAWPPAPLIVEDLAPAQHYAAEYRLDVDAIRALPQIKRPKPVRRGDKMSTLKKPRGDTATLPEVTTGSPRGDNGAAQPSIGNPTTNPTTDPPTPTPGGAEGVTATGFDAFWGTYPRKKNKGDAEKVWKQIKPDAATCAAILAAIAWQRETWDWRKSNGAYIPHPAKWLRAKGWLDERPAESTRDAGLRAAAGAVLEPAPPQCTCPHEATFAASLEGGGSLAAFLAGLGSRIPADEHAVWGGHLRVLMADAGRLALYGAPNAFYRSRIEKQFRQAVLEAARETWPTLGIGPNPQLRVHLRCAVHAETEAGVG